MKGINNLRLNHETICEAVQMYLNAQMADNKSPEVTAVNYNAQETTFVVTVKGREEIKQP